MNRVLQIDSSIFANEGVSSRLAEEFVQALRAENPEIQVRRRNLGAEPLPHLDVDRLTAISTPPAQRDANQQAIAAQADELIAELQESDLIVIGAPMYNFSIPSQLKAWFDHIARAGTTFRYTETGPQGLLTGKRAVIFTSRGGLHKDSPSDSQTPLIRSFLALLGITEIEFVYAEGLAMGEAARSQGMDAASAELRRISAELRQAA